MTDVIGIGEVCVDHVCVLPAWPGPGGKVRMQEYGTQPGGQVATAMVACARLGLRVKFLGRVGDDAAGQQALLGLSHEGVDTSGVQVVAGASTQTAVILVDAQSGERAVIWHQDDRLTLDDVPAEKLSGARALHVDVTGVPASLAGLRAARAAGMLTSIDIDHVPRAVDEILALIDLCVMAEEFPHALTGEKDRERALRGVRKWCPNGTLVVTLGKDGAIALDGDRVIHVPAFSVRAVDTTACGDVFRGAFLYGTLAGWDLERRLRFASAAAALKTRKLGAQPGIPTLSEVESFLSTGTGSGGRTP
jgi:sugar/nucleoside kinase (ribokinase family)